MKFLFLDIDGVLNSADFYKNYEDKTDEELRDMLFDPSCIACVKDIVDATGASIVLTSSWRDIWEKDPSECSYEGQLLNSVFSSFGLSIYDKTACLPGGRSAEIRHFMKTSGEKITGYVIIDDNDFGWKKAGLLKHVVQTDFMEGGLKIGHVPEAIRILNRRTALRCFLRLPDTSLRKD